MQLKFFTFFIFYLYTIFVVFFHVNYVIFHVVVSCDFMQNLINVDLINVQENKREKMPPKGKIMSLNATTICTWQVERVREMRHKEMSALMTRN